MYAEGVTALLVLGLGCLLVRGQARRGGKASVGASAAVEGTTELQALIAYLQHLGSAVKNRSQ